MSPEERYMTEPVWAEIICPRCGHKVQIGMLSLAALCGCGFYYVDRIPPQRVGWFRSREAYNRGEAPIR